MKHYVMPSLKEQKLDIAVIHIGGKNINYKNKDNVNVNELIDNIISLATLCRDFGVSDVVVQPKKSIAVNSIIR